MEWTTEDSEAANREGWDLFDSYGSDNGPLQLCKIDDPETWRADRDVIIDQEFDDDTDAWLFVRDNPSELHTKALTILRHENWQEYARIMRWNTNGD